MTYGGGFWQPGLTQQHHAAIASCQDVKPFVSAAAAAHAQSPFNLSAASSAAQAASQVAAAMEKQPHSPASSGGMGGLAAAAAAASGGSAMQPVWHNRAIATHKLRLLEFTAYVEQQREQQESYNKHHFVHIAGPVSYSDPLLEVIIAIALNTILF